MDDEMPPGMLLVGNKHDLDEQNEREVSLETGKTFARVGPLKEEIPLSKLSVYYYLEMKYSSFTDHTIWPSHTITINICDHT